MGKKIEALKTKANEVYGKAKETGKKAWTWVKENPGLAIAGGSIVAGYVYDFKKQARKDKEAKDELLRIWDPVQGDYLYTRKPLTGRQKLEFETRVQNGQPRAEALHEMKVLDLRR